MYDARRAVAAEIERFKYCNWIKRNKKLLYAGEKKDDRVALFKKLVEMGE